MLETVQIDKLVHGGQALGTLSDGRKVLVWNALPSETVGVRLVKSKNKFAEGIAEEVIVASPERVEPKDEAYLSTSPWQIMSYEAENRYKAEILQETFEREKVKIPAIAFESGADQWQYRNKMEYSFWADDHGLHLALFHRGSHGKRIVTGSSIAHPEIDEVANKICAILNQAGMRGSQLKTVMVRCNQAGECVAAIFTKDEDFPQIPQLASVCKGLVIYYSNPKSPASIATKELYNFGDPTLTDKVLESEIRYNVTNFFQVNLPVFEQALINIRKSLRGNPLVDFYSGVGTIGIPVGAKVLVESDEQNVHMAQENATGVDSKVIQTTAENALDYIPSKGTLIVDPPRAGLHPKLTEAVRDKRPDTIVYLSCNPITQARDIAILQDTYQLKSLTGYNFFPRTPHIESLAILHKQSN